MAPKISTSVAKKIHMPNVAVSRCCSRFSKWWARTAWLVDKSALLHRVFVGSRGDDGRLVKVVRRRRRGRLPFQARSVPGIGAGRLAGVQRPEHVKQRQHVTDGQDRGP